MKLSIKAAMIATTVILLSATSVFAQSTQIRIHVPFAFDAGNSHLTAGDYRVVKETYFQMVTLEKVGGAAIFLPSQRAFTGTAIKENGALTFDKYGDKYFLRKFSTPGTGGGYEWPMSRAEREIAKLGVPGEVASIEAGTK
jgi:hypothetical protein